MHYHQYQFIDYYAKESGAKSILIFGDVPTNLPQSIVKGNQLVSEFLKHKGYQVDVASNVWKSKSTHKPKQSYDMIIDFRECALVKKATAYNILKNIQTAAHEGTVIIHFSPVKNHFPGFHRNSDLGGTFWGELLANDSILEIKQVGAHHNTETGLETYIAYKKQKRAFSKKRVLEILSKA